MGKIVELEDLTTELNPLRKTRTIGLITGRFDLINTSYISFFRFAKRNADIVVVGVDADIAIRKTFFNRGPIHTQDDRLKVLSEMASIDYVVPLKNMSSYSTKAANAYYDKLARKINPNYLITSTENDLYWQNKKERIEAIGGSLILSDADKENSIASRVTNLFVS